MVEEKNGCLIPCFLADWRVHLAFYRPHRSLSWTPLCIKVMVVVSPVEAERRERYVREYTRPRALLDPFTWPYRYKGAGAFGGAYLIATHLYNKWNKKPWYYGK